MQSEMPERESSISLSTSLDLQQLGDCNFINHIMVKGDGSYESNKIDPIQIFPSSNENQLLDLSSTVQKIQNRRPFRFFGHPKHLDPILGGCIQSEKAHLLKEGNAIVTWRGILSRIFLGDSVTLHASYIDGVMYMEEKDSKPQWRAHRYFLSDAVGMAFEEVYTHPIRTQPNSEQLNLQWGNIVSRALGEFKLIFCGEVDSVRDDIGSGEASDWFGKRVELKTKSIQSTSSINQSLPKWHMQSSLLGVPEIFVGLRNDSLRITQTQVLLTSEIKPNNYDINIQKGYEALKHLYSTLANRVAELGNDDMIWAVTVKNHSVTEIIELDETQASQVKKRRENKQNPVERVGIIPKDCVRSLRQ